jgi:hypothetical protein
MGHFRLSIRVRFDMLTDVESPAADEPVPVWLLDVDGVLNANRPGWGAPPRQGSATFEGQAFQMRWAARLMLDLARLHHDRVVEFRWATTWVDQIDQIETLFRLPAFPVAFSGLPLGPQSKTPAFKAKAALEVVETERRPLIWTDDDAIPAGGPLLRRLQASGQPLLLIAPDPRRGLQPTHLKAVTEFLSIPDAASADALAHPH